MSSFLNSLEGKLTTMEQEIQAFPGELDSIVAHIDWGKLRSLSLRLEQDFNKLLDQLFASQRMNALLSPFILLPDGLNGPLYRRITQEDLAKWRDAHKSDIRVVIGEGRVEVIVPSELAREHKTTVSQVILAAQQQGYTVLGWDQYQKLLDEIHKLIGGGEEQSRITGSAGHTVIGIPVSTTDSTDGVKMLPQSSAL